MGETLDLQIILEHAQVSAAPGLDASPVGAIRRRLEGVARCVASSPGSGEVPVRSLPSPPSTGLKWAWGGRSIWVRVARGGTLRIAVLLEQKMPMPLLAAFAVNLDPVLVGEVKLAFSREVEPLLKGMNGTSPPVNKRLTVDGMEVGEITMRFSTAQEPHIADAKKSACCFCGLGTVPGCVTGSGACGTGQMPSAADEAAGGGPCPGGRRKRRSRRKFCDEEWVETDGEEDSGHSYPGTTEPSERPLGYKIEGQQALTAQTIDKSQTLLHVVAANGRTQHVSELIRKGALTSVRDKDGETPLHVAAAGGHHDTCLLLLNSGADPHARDVRGRTPLDLAVAAQAQRRGQQKVQAQRVSGLLVDFMRVRKMEHRHH